MKKQCLLVAVMMVILLGFGSMSWAGEASVFDSAQGILIRLFTTGTAPYISAYLEARDDEGNRLAGDQVAVTKENGTIVPYTPETLEGPLKDTFLLHGPSKENALTTHDVSMSFDGQFAYVFCTDALHNGDPHMMKFRVALQGSGFCGSSAGKTFTAAPADNLCSSGTPSPVTGSGALWNWSCTGTTGDPVPCTANIKTYTVTPSAGADGNISPVIPQTVNHGSTTSFTVTPNSGYSIASVTGCSGSLSGSTYTTGAITGDCTVSATFTLRTWTVSTSAGTGGSISPTSQTVNNGSSTSFTVTPNSGYSIASVTGCSGSLSGSTYTTGAITGDCTVSATFVTVPTTGNSDLAISSIFGFGTSYEVGSGPFNLNITIANRGNDSTASANRCVNRQFTVKGYQSTSGTTTGTPIFTWYVNDLAAGQSVSKTVSMVANADCPIHTWCVFNFKVDADDCVAESDEKNNISGRASYRAR